MKTISLFIIVRGWRKRAIEIEKDYECQTDRGEMV